jgi:hypothetical protein
MELGGFDPWKIVEYNNNFACPVTTNLHALKFGNKKKGKRKEMEKWDNENGKENKNKWEYKGKGK